jgi:hypothetical protein
MALRREGSSDPGCCYRAWEFFTFAYIPAGLGGSGGGPAGPGPRAPSIPPLPARSPRHDSARRSTERHWAALGGTERQRSWPHGMVQEGFCQPRLDGAETASGAGRGPPRPLGRWLMPPRAPAGGGDRRIGNGSPRPPDLFRRCCQPGSGSRWRPTLERTRGWASRCVGRHR